MITQREKLKIRDYIIEVKKLLSAGNFDFVPRRKNIQSLTRCGLTINDVKEEIFGLTVGDYYKGPKKDLDNNRSGEIWEFKKMINGKKFYIKLKIIQQGGKNVLKCLGFHEDCYAEIRG